MWASAVAVVTVANRDMHRSCELVTVATGIPASRMRATSFATVLHSIHASASVGRNIPKAPTIPLLTVVTGSSHQGSPVREHWEGSRSPTAVAGWTAPSMDVTEPMSPS